MKDKENFVTNHVCLVTSAAQLCRIKLWFNLETVGPCGSSSCMLPLPLTLGSSAYPGINFSLYFPASRNWCKVAGIL